MKRKYCRLTKYILTAILGVSLAVTSAAPAIAATKEEVQNQIANLQAKQGELETKLAGLKENKSNTEAYIGELDKEIDSYKAQVEQVSQDIIKTDAEITVASENLDQAQKDKEAQYEALKARIKAMYEAGEEDYVEMILNADDIKSLLNNQEYSSKINEYDHELLTSLQETEDKIQRYEEELEDKKDLQEAQKEKYELQKADLEKVVAQKQDELVSIGANIDSVSSDISTTQEEIDQENDLLAQIIEAERIAAEEEARRRAAEEEAARQRAAQEKAAREEAAQAAVQEQDEDEDSYDEDSSYSEDYSSNDSDSSEDSYDSYEDSSEDSYDSYEDNDDDDDYYEEDSSSSDSYYEEEETSSYASTGFIWPVGSSNITSYFGYRDSPTAGASSYHQGLDISAGEGSGIYAAASGTVTTASYSNAMGNYVVISHGNGVSTVYEHCSALYVSAGQSVSQGQTIAAVGSTGISTGAHLHFGVSVGGSYVNPLAYVSP